MAEGKVKKIVSEKGFGFIEGDGGDIFFHHSGLVGVAIEELREGELVKYDVGRGPKGPRAENVERA